MKILSESLRKFNGRHYQGTECPTSVPDEMLNEDWAKIIHGQTLSGLNKRGGMSASEIMCNIKKLDYESIPPETPELLAELKQLIANYHSSSNAQASIASPEEKKSKTAIMSAIEQSDALEKEHPYKQRGNPDSYSSYNEGWCDAIDRMQSILRSLLPCEQNSIQDAHTEGMICIHELLKQHLPNMPHTKTDAEIAKFRVGEPDEKSKDYYLQTYQSK